MLGLFVISMFVGLMAIVAFSRAKSAEKTALQVRGQVSRLVETVNRMERDGFGKGQAQSRASHSITETHVQIPRKEVPISVTSDDLVLGDLHEVEIAESPIASSEKEPAVSEAAISDVEKKSVPYPPTKPPADVARLNEAVGPSFDSVPRVDVQSLEMKLGTFWFVRIGVMLLLTGLAFLAYYKKQFFIELPPAAKVSGFYLLCFAMSGIGFWLSKTQEKLKSYAQVLIAGGFAGVYFTINASHLFEPIKVIENMNVAVGCLVLWGAFLVWVSDRLQSETLAIFTVGASYYATYVPLIHTGEISQWLLLSSNLVLAVTSVGFMLKNRWLGLPFLGMTITYAGFAVTQIGLNIVPFSTVLLFVASLWTVYTIAVFLSRSESFPDLIRVWFVNLNNAAMFGLVSVVVLRHNPSQFWLFSLSTGALLFAVAMLATRFLKDYPLSRKTYVVHGLLLANIGIMTYDMSGSLLGPVLAAESLLLAVLTIRGKSRIPPDACLIVSVIAAIYASVDTLQHSDDFLSGGLIVAGLLLLSARLFDFAESTNHALLRPQTGLMTALGLTVGILGVFVAFDHLPGWSDQTEWLPALLFAIPVVFSAASYRVNIREFALLSQASGILGLVLAFYLALGLETFSWPVSIACLLTLSLVHWWFWQRNRFVTSCHGIPEAKLIPQTLEAIYSIGLITQGLLIMYSLFHFDLPWIWIGSVMTVVLTFYAVTTRTFFLGVFSQVFLVISVAKMVEVCLFGNGQHPLLTLVPIGAVCVVNALISIWYWRLCELLGVQSSFLKNGQMVLRILAAGLSVIWIQNFVPHEWLMLAYTTAGIGFFVIHSIRTPRDLGWISMGYASLALLAFLAQATGGHAFWQSGLALLAVMAFQQTIRRHEKQFEVSGNAHRWLILLGGALTMIWVTIKISDLTTNEINGIRTMAWTVLGVVYFALGIGLRERWYRLMGLMVLAISLLSIAPSFWDMSTEIKIASVFVMGAVFVGLGFIYSRYKESLKKLL